jgi:type IV secretion system protein VirB8
MSGDIELERYCAEAATWDTDRMAQCLRSARIAWRVAGSAVLLSLVSAVGLMLLLPLKSVEPFLVRVDNSTGVVDVVPQYTASADPGEVVTRYLLTQYVRVCESFDIDSAESDYEQCGAFNAPRLNQALYSRWTASNPESPLNAYRDGTTVHTRIKSVTFLKRHGSGVSLAQVRYHTGTRTGGSGSEKLSHWIATIEYGYEPPAKDGRMRAWNPLGLRVKDFRKESELIDSSEPELAGRVSAAMPSGTKR